MDICNTGVLPTSEYLLSTLMTAPLAPVSQLPFGPYHNPHFGMLFGVFTALTAHLRLLDGLQGSLLCLLLRQPWFQCSAAWPKKNRRFQPSSGGFPGSRMDQSSILSSQSQPPGKPPSVGQSVLRCTNELAKAGQTRGHGALMSPFKDACSPKASPVHLTPDRHASL